jgi:hypothetical protein
VLAAFGTGEPSTPNPFAIPALSRIALEPFLLIGIGFLASGIAAQMVRFRQGTPMERQQLKWLMYPTALFTAVAMLQALAPATGLAQIPVLMAFLDFSIGIIYLLFPIAIGIAILRYRLWDIDVIIRKTLVYAALTATLALVFFGGVALLQQVFGCITGIESSPIAIVLSTLAIAALFSPLHRRTQDFIDRRFYRSKYNAEQALEAFAALARSETDLEALTGKLMDLISETMQPEKISIWLSKTSPEK